MRRISLVINQIDECALRGLSFAFAPSGTNGRRIMNLRVKGEPLEAAKRYRVAAWAPVAQIDIPGVPVWEPIQDYLRSRKIIRIESVNTPQLL